MSILFHMMKPLSWPCHCTKLLINTVLFSTEWNILIKTFFLLYHKLSIMLVLLHAKLNQCIWPLSTSGQVQKPHPQWAASDVQKGRAVSMWHISQRTKEHCNFPITLRLPLQSSQYVRQKQSITENQDSYEMAKIPLSLCVLTVL